MTDGALPLVDVIVPVHSTSRPIRRLAESILPTTRAPLRLTFVCHNVDSVEIGRALGPHVDDARVRLLEFTDDTRSPAGPFNRGLEAATASFVVKVDSDDTLEPGAIDAWIMIQQRTNADIVIARMVSDAGVEWSTPPTRLGRRAMLDPVHDRLSYRTSTMGLISREAFLDARSTTGLETGEDILPSLRLWFSGRPIALADREPAYVVHGGSDDRTTAEERSVASEFAWLDRLLANPWFSSLPPRSLHSIAAKLLRVQVFSAVANRSTPTAWTPADRAALAGATERIVALSPKVVGVLSIADADLLDAIRDPNVGDAELLARAERRRRFGHPTTLLSSRLLRILAAEAPPRLVPAFLYALRRGHRLRRRNGL